MLFLLTIMRIVINERVANMTFSTKRGLVLFLAMAAICMMLAACGSANGGNQPASEGSITTEPSQPSATTEVTERVITHLKGTTTVPAHPQKIFVMQSEYADHLLTIGEKPYGMLVTPQYNNKVLPYMAKQLEGIHLLEGGSEALNLEAVLELAPDLILINKQMGEVAYEDLTKIAPTIVLGIPEHDSNAKPDPNAGLVSDDWQIDLRKVAEIFGKEEVAEQAIAELDRKAAAVKEKLEALDGKRTAYIRVREKELQLYGSEGHPLNYLLYDKLGLEPSELTETERIELSQEKIPELGADYIFLQTDGIQGESMLEEIAGSKLWESVPAVQQQQMLVTEYWLYLSWGTLGRSTIIDQITDFLNV